MIKSIMANIWFTADDHINHTNIIKHTNRPFASIEEMDNVLINNWNSVVAPNDTVYVLGDFVWFKRTSATQSYLDRLKGKKILIMGNHDDNRTAKASWQEVYDLKTIRIDNQFIVLSHYGMRTWDKSFHGSWCLFGHSHSRLPPYGKSFDVGVDCWNYTPISYDFVRDKMKELEQFDGENDKKVRIENFYMKAKI